MKKSLIKISLLALVISMTTAGCKKFLDQEIPGAFSQDDFYKTDDDVTQAVTGVYQMMQAHYNGNWASMYMIKSLLDDDTNAGGSNEGDQPGYQTLDDYNFDAIGCRKLYISIRYYIRYACRADVTTSINLYDRTSSVVWTARVVLSPSHS